VSQSSRSCTPKSRTAIAFDESDGLQESVRAALERSVIDWRSARLGSVLKVKHGYAFAGPAFSSDLSGLPIVVSIGNFDYRGGFRFATTQNREYRGGYPKEF